MGSLNFVATYNPVLYKKAQAVSLDQISSPQIQMLISKMYSIAIGEQKDPQKPVMVGLAAPQIGSSLRIILVDIAADGQGASGNLKTYINPEVSWQSSTTSQWYEGCFSIKNICGVLARPDKIRVKAYDRNGLSKEEEFDGYTARIFLHEIDHLNGILFADLIKQDQDLHWVEEAEFTNYRNQQAWRNWKKLCSREKWIKTKHNSTKK